MKINDDKSVTFDYNETLLLIRKAVKQYNRAKRNIDRLVAWHNIYPDRNGGYYVTRIEKNKQVMDDFHKFHNLYELLYRNKQLKEGNKE